MLEFPAVMLAQGFGTTFLAPARAPQSPSPLHEHSNQRMAGAAPRPVQGDGKAATRAMWHARKDEVVSGYCEVCGANAPTAFVTLRRQIGLLVARLERQVEGHLCKVCIGTYFREFTPATALLGWWGIPALFATPAILGGNFRARKAAQALPDTPQSPADPQRDAVRALLEAAPLAAPVRAGGQVPARQVVTLGPPPLYLLDERTGASAALCDGLTVGSSRDRATLVLDDPLVAGLHARVEREGNEFVLIDAKSGERRPLKQGMHLRLGATSLVVLNPALGTVANARYAAR
jgi:hypothetical protein